MKALIWKEYREKRLWVLKLVAVAVFAMWRGGGYTFMATGGGNMNQSASLPVILVLFFGAGAFASELDKAASFAFTQSVSWKKLLCAKLIVGLAILTVSAVLSAVIYRMICPAKYVQFATLHQLGIGVLWAIVLTGTAYLAGVTCSVCLPGAVSGVFIVGTAYFLVVLQVMLSAKIRSEITGAKQYVLTGNDSSFIIWLIALLLAMWLTARSGLTQQTRDRVIRFFTVMAVFFVLNIVLGAAGVSPEQSLLAWYNKKHPSVFYGSSISPDGRHAITMSVSKIGSIARYALIGPSGKRVVFDPWNGRHSGDPAIFTWVSPDAFIYDSYSAKAPLAVAKLEGNGKASVSTIAAYAGVTGYLIAVPSASGRKVLLVPARSITTGESAYWRAPNPSDRILPENTDYRASVDTDAGAVSILDCGENCRATIIKIKQKAIWWQSGDEIGYLDEHSQRHIARLGRI